MKKFSMNLLKIGMALIIGLCVFGICNEVNATEDQEVDNVILVMHFNGGVNSEGKKFEAECYEKGEEIALEVREDIEREGHILVGWATKADATGDELEYDFGQAFTLEENKMVYAIWEEDKVIVDDEEDKVVDDEEDKVVVDDEGDKVVDDEEVPSIGGFDLSSLSGLADTAGGIVQMILPVVQQIIQFVISNVLPMVIDYAPKVMETGMSLITNIIGGF